MANAFAATLIDEVSAFFAPLTETKGRPDAVFAFLESAGWPIEKIAGVQPGPLQRAVAAVIQAVDTLAQVAADPPQQTEAVLLAIGQSVGPALEALASLPAAWPQGQPSDMQELPADVLSALTARWLASSHHVAYEVLRVLGILIEGSPELLENGGEVYHVRHVAPRLNFGQVSALLTRPQQAFTAIYWPGTQPDAVAGATQLAERLLSLAIALGFDPYQLAIDEVDGLDLTLLPDDGLVLSYAVPLSDEVMAQAGVAMASDPTVSTGPSVSLVPFGQLAFDVTAGDWLVGLSGALEGQAIDIDGNGIRQRDGGKPPLTLQLQLARGDAGKPALLFGSESGSRLSIDRLGFGASLLLGGPKAEAKLSLALNPLSFRLASGAADGFLKTILPPEGLGGEAELTLEWSSLRGVRLGGSANLTLELARRISLGPITIDGLQVQLSPQGDRLQLRVCADVGAKIGPMSGSVQGLGLGVALSAPATGGNMGPFELSTSFVPPKGIGLAIDASVVKGGGFISLDHDKQEYSGVLALSIQKTIDLKAIGILNAKLPDNRSGFSLLLIITGEFPPIQLGMGFTLNGVGGLVGINRTAAVDVLRGGLRNGTLDSILFPPDPLHNVPALLRTVSSVFPVAEGRHVFGPMVRIGWGSPTVLTLDVAVLIELPDPVRIILLGRLKAALPDAKKPVAIIHMDAVGVLDFSRQTLSLDASIYDSRILAFTLSGDMALRLTWGAQTSFLLSIGGFHPHFLAPAGMPALGRIAIVLVDQDKDGVVARVRLDAYVALTSNTFQFGARVEAYVKVMGLEVQGLLGFDALVHFPFAIEAEMAAAVTLSFNGAMLMGAEVALMLTGPQPWHLVGEAKFVFLGIKARAAIELNSGSAGAGAPELPPPADVATLLKAALEDVRNWQAALPAGSGSFASMRPAVGVPEKTLLVPPLASLLVRQRVAPLGQALSRHGNAPVQDGTSRFDLSLDASTPSSAVSPLEEAFAMAQYQVMSDDEKLSRPSFEQATAGLQFEQAAFAYPADLTFRLPDMVFEGTSPGAVPTAVHGAVLVPTLHRAGTPDAVGDVSTRAYFHARSAPAQSASHRSGKGRYAAAPASRLTERSH